MTGAVATVGAAVTARTASPAAVRITSIDIVRGAVMVLMAIDHVRVYSGVPAGGPTPGIFFTRWVTHFCAPVFVFLAGTAAFLYGRSLGDTRTLFRYLLTRGMLLVALELTIIHFSWTFSLASMTAPLAGVIWMLGWCMVLLATLISLPIPVITGIGLLIVVAQDAMQLLPDGARQPAWLWNFLYFGGDVAAGPVSFSVLYTIVPWVGVMAVGFAFGAIVVRDPAERRQLCLRIGLTATALFLLIAGGATLLAPAPEDAPPALFRLLNQRKYPASPLFLLMTLGPAIAVLPLVERATNWLTRGLALFGRVPMFYYLLHIPLIHLTALLVWGLRDGRIGADRFTSAPYVAIPPDERWSLPLLYAVFAAVVVMLYFACRWFARLKTTRSQGWLRYM